MNETPDEGNQTQLTGGTEPSTSSPSGSGGQPLPEYVTTIISRLDNTEKLLKGLQKGTDKQIGQVKNEIKRILELKEQGLNETQIERELWIDRQMSDRNVTEPEPVPDKTVPGVSGDAISVADAISQIERYNLPVNDPTVIELMRDRNLTGAKVKDYILGRVAPPKPANPADVVQAPVRNTAPGEKSPAQLETDYQKEAQAILQTKTGDERLRAISGLKAKYRAAGLNKI